MNKHTICLTEEQRRSLSHLVSSGSAPARQILHAQILLKVDESPQGPNWSNKQLYEAFGVVESTIWRVRLRFLEHGLDASIQRRRQPERPESRKLTGEQEAHLIALACQAPAEGRPCWTLRLLADKLVELEIVEQISHETVRCVLKKMNCSPGARNNGVFHPRPTRLLSRPWRTCSLSTKGPTIPRDPRSVWMR